MDLQHLLAKSVYCLLGFGKRTIFLDTSLFYNFCFHRGRGWVELLPSFDPSSHGIPKLLEIRIKRGELLLDQLGELEVAFLHSCALFRQRNRLEEGGHLFLPVNSLVLLLQVHKGVACLAVPYVWQPSLHSRVKWSHIT